jgi:hypothetical protein
MLRGYVYKNIAHLFRNCRVINEIDDLGTEHVASGICLQCRIRKSKEDAKLKAVPR